MTNVYKPENSFKKILEKKKKNLKFDVSHKFIVEKLQSKYEIIQSLGEGNFAVLFLGKDIETSEKVAIKCSKNKSFTLEREFHLLKKFDCHNIIKAIDFYEMQEDEVLIMEYGGTRTLKDLQSEK